MYRSRMPYTRWHAKSDLLKQRMKLSMTARYGRLQQTESSTADNTSESEHDRHLADQDTETASERSDEVVVMSETSSTPMLTREKTKANVQSIRQRQIELERKCKRLGFGTQSKRFPGSKKDCPPAPGTYEIRTSCLNIAPPSTKREEEPFTLASRSSRTLASKTSLLGPGIYEPRKVSDMNTIVETKGRFDTSTEPRCGPIKSGYMATVMKAQFGPRFTKFPSFIDQMNSSNHHYKGKFSQSARFHPLTTQHDLSPNSYNPQIPNRKTSFNQKQVPFLKQSERMTKKQYDRFIGNVNPYTGPGCYNVTKHERPSKAITFGKAKLDAGNMMKERLKPTNIPSKWTSFPLHPDRDGYKRVGKYLKIY